MSAMPFAYRFMAVWATDAKMTKFVFEACLVSQ